MRIGTFINIIILLTIVWAAGLFIFVHQVENLTEPAIDSEMENTDGIVVLTGGSERVPAGLALLRAGKAQKLFISGVHPGLTLDNVIGNQQISKGLHDCCIILGHAAESTFGNADETRTWVILEDAHSLRLVTANYHMPRSLMLFRAAMPNINIIPHPVTPDKVRLSDWWQHPGTASLLIFEYSKYLGAFVRLWLGAHV